MRLKHTNYRYVFSGDHSTVELSEPLPDGTKVYVSLVFEPGSIPRLVGVGNPKGEWYGIFEPQPKKNGRVIRDRFSQNLPVKDYGLVQANNLVPCFTYNRDRGIGSREWQPIR